MQYNRPINLKNLLIVLNKFFPFFLGSGIIIIFIFILSVLIFKNFFYKFYDNYRHTLIVNFDDLMDNIEKYNSLINSYEELNLFLYSEHKLKDNFNNEFDDIIQYISIDIASSNFEEKYQGFLKNDYSIDVNNRSVNFNYINSENKINNEIKKDFIQLVNNSINNSKNKFLTDQIKFLNTYKKVLKKLSLIFEYCHNNKDRCADIEKDKIRHDYLYYKAIEKKYFPESQIQSLFEELRNELKIIKDLEVIKKIDTEIIIIKREINYKLILIFFVTIFTTLIFIFSYSYLIFKNFRKGQ